MASHWGPKNETAAVFNVNNFNYLQDTITVENQNSTDATQNQLVADIVASTNTLSTSISANTAYQSKVDTLEDKTVDVSLLIEDDPEQEALEILEDRRGSTRERGWYPVRQSNKSYYVVKNFIFQ